MKKSLQVQMTFWVLGAVVVISTAILSYVATMIRIDYEAEINENLKDAIETTSSSIKIRLSRVECATNAMAKIMTDYTDDPVAMDSILSHTLVGMGCIDAVSRVSCENMPDGRRRITDRYACYGKDKRVLLKEVCDTACDTDYLVLKRTLEYGTCSWSNPVREIDPRKEIILGYCVPLNNQKGERVGVVYSSLKGKWFGDIVRRYRTRKDIDVAVVASNGDTIINHSDYIKRLKPEEMIREHIYIDHLGWTFIFSIDRHVISDKVNEVLFRIGMIMLVLILTLCIAIIIVVKYVAQPFMKKLYETETRNVIMEHDIESAAKTQRELVPHVFPPFPERNDIDIYACLHPARNVGGDLYDYFIDNDNLYFCIGDVSGKGTQASLFMSATRYLFRSVASSLPMGEAMQRINLSLCTDNASCMFVTFFFGRLDLTTGEMEYCNAGHNSPIMTGDGKAWFLPPAENMPLGVYGDAEFETCHIEMGCKQILLLYTDGVTEAADAKGKQFDNAETLRVSAEHDNPEDLVNAMLQRIRTHAYGAEQSDDITMLAIKSYNSKTA